ncbi:MAG: hypothetical protein AB8G86_12560 [Saprospiraceae bacterium]
MELSTKIANIKEKITQLASKMENLRLENRLLVEENSKLSTKLQRDAEETSYLKHQLAILRAQLLTQSPKAVIEEEE